MKKKDIIQLVKKIVKEGAYPDATLTTQGPPNSSRAVVSTDEYPFTAKPKARLPGVWESESTSFKVVNADTGKTIDFGLDQAKAEEIVISAKEDNINAKVVKMKNVDDVGTLKEFTSMGQEGIYPRKEKRGDMFQQQEVEELLPNGMASRDDRAFQDRLKQHADWTEESFNNRTFVHIQYHDSFDREHSYRIHQSQNYNGNYDDFRNPKFTVLTITKKKEGKEEKLGRYIVDTDAYLKDFAKLRNDDVLGKQVSEDYKPSHRAYDVIDKSNNDEIKYKKLSRDRALEKAHTNPNYMIKATDSLAEEEVHGKEIVITAESLQNALTFIGKNLENLSSSMLSKLLNILKLSSINDFPYNVRDLKSKLKQMTPEEAKTFGLELNKFHTDMKRKNIKSEDVNVIDKLAPTGDSEKIKKSTGAGSSIAVKKAISVAKNSPDTTVTLVTKGVSEEVNFNDDSANHAKMQLQKAAEYSVKLAKMMNDMTQLPSWVQSKITKASDYMSAVYHYLDYETQNNQTKPEEMDINEMINDYIKKRGDDNLMEQVDKYHKRAQLREERMEKATESLFTLFNQGKTDAEVRSIYLTKNIDMPDSFISKLRNNWESLRKTKLDLTLADKEAEGFQQLQQPKAIAGMEDGDVGMEEDKKLASGLFNETK